MLHSLDIVLLAAYLLVVTGVGIAVSQRASKSMSEYFLGGRRIPWYILGISGMATYLSLTGTMLMASFFFLFGVKAYWIAFRGNVALLLAFLMIFMAKWLNRSGAMTNAEWIEFRFGRGPQGRTARFLCAASNQVVAVALMANFFVAAEKFLAVFLPFNPTISAIVFFTIVMIYTVAAGFHGVVYTDLIQSVLVFGTIAYVVVKAMAVGTPEYYAEHTQGDWHTLLPSWHMDMPAGYETLSAFGLLIIFWIVSNVFQGFAFPTDGWSSQRYYAAKDERESALVAWQWIVLFSLRFSMMVAIGVLALSIAGDLSDPEMAVPAVINHFVPIGLKGLLLAGLIAAEMSSLDSIANASAAYFVRDIYQAFLKPDASRAVLVRVSYCTTAALFVVSVLLGLFMPNLNLLWAWFIMGLINGMIPPNILKWFWWRFNGVGYVAGMTSGILSAVLYAIFVKEAPEHATFCFVLGIATVGTVIGTFLGKPSDNETLLHFYRRTRPFGFWGHIRAKCEPEFISSVRRENHRDLLLLVPACLWQAFLFWMMTAFVVKKWLSFGVSALLVVALSWVLYEYWYKNLMRGSHTSDARERN